jgi:hypothetical protein
VKTAEDQSRTHFLGVKKNENTENVGNKKYKN